MAKRALDVIVFGATGDTGSAACRFLYHYGRKVQIQKWAPAARNLKRLQANVLDPLLQYSAGDDGILPSKPIYADANDLESLICMCKQARVVMSFTGPYELFGEKIIAACIATGTHYVDVTGEVPWVSSMMKKYGNAAQQSGACFVSFCGYDSVPMDMSAFLLKSALEEQGDTLDIVETYATNRSKGGGAIPTGTVNTVLGAVAQLRSKFYRALTFGIFHSDKISVTPAAEENGIHLGGSRLLTPEAYRAVKRDLAANRWPYRSIVAPGKIWSSPHFMGTINTNIVHATASKDNKFFHYRERELSGGKKCMERADGSLTSFAKTLVTPAILFMLSPLALTPFFDTVVWAFVNRINGKKSNLNSDDPGLNQIQRLMNAGETTGFVGVYGYGQAEPSQKKAVSSFECDFDAGIGCTVLTCCAMAGALAQDCTSISPGFQTSVNAIGGETLRKALARTGVRMGVSVLGQSRL